MNWRTKFLYKSRKFPLFILVLIWLSESNSWTNVCVVLSVIHMWFGRLSLLFEQKLTFVVLLIVIKMNNITNVLTLKCWFFQQGSDYQKLDDTIKIQVNNFDLNGFLIDKTPRRLELSSRLWRSIIQTNCELILVYTLDFKWKMNQNSFTNWISLIKSQKINSQKFCTLSPNTHDFTKNSFVYPVGRLLLVN